MSREHRYQFDFEIRNLIAAGNLKNLVYFYVACMSIRFAVHQVLGHGESCGVRTVYQSLKEAIRMTHVPSCILFFGNFAAGGWEFESVSLFLSEFFLPAAFLP